MISRPAAVAGQFYPQDSNELKQQIQNLLQQAHNNSRNLNKTQQAIALIVPHAGYIYSGLTAAYAYQEIIPYAELIKRVIIFGPSHRVAFNGMAVPDVSSFQTPLGNIPLDNKEIQYLVEQQLLLSNQAHEQEHSIEVQLPFLQATLNNFQLIPIVVGQSNSREISAVLSRYISNPENLILISTDLSHFSEYSIAQQHDQKTCEKIMQFKYNELDYDDACGRLPLSGMLRLAKEKNYSIQQLDIRNSGDTAGDKQRVVGYGSWSIYANV
jgi:MEMO1 family protein